MIELLLSLAMGQLTAGNVVCASPCISVPEIAATGTPSATTYLRGDGTWTAPPGAGAAYDTVQEEGTNITQRSKLNFIGPRITCADNAGSTRTDCTVSAAPVTTGANLLLGDGGGGFTSYGGTSCTNQFPRSLDGAGAATCASVADADVTPAYSGVGACGANTWASTLTRNAAPTCTQPGFANLSGSATSAQLPGATAGAQGAVNLAGDLAGAGSSAASPQVTNDSHDHTTTTISGLDAGADFTAGTLPIARGGTNTTATPTAGGVGYGTGTALAWSAAGTGGDCLKSGGTGAPTWGACAAGGGYATVQDEGTGLTARTTLNFAGAGVTCADDTTRTTCTIPGGGGSAPAWASAVIAAFGDGEPDDILRHLQRAGNTAATPTNITTSVARVSFFRPQANITVNKIRFYGVGATTNVYRVAIYSYNIGSSTGTRLTAELPFSTTANAWGAAGSALGLSLTAGTLYFVAVSVNATGTTPGVACIGTTVAATTGQIQTAPQSLPGNLDADAGYLTGYRAQFAVTTGALPATTPALAAQAAWAGGMPVFFLDNSNL